MAGGNVLFGVNTHNRTSTTLAFQEFDVCIDTSGGPGFTPNKVLIGINGAAFSSTLPNTLFVTALFPTDANCTINGNGTLLFNMTQPTDNSTLLLAVPAESRPGLGLTAASPRFKYAMFYFGTDGFGALMPGIGSFNAFTPAITFGGRAHRGAERIGHRRQSPSTPRSSPCRLRWVRWCSRRITCPAASQGLLVSLPVRSLTARSAIARPGG